MRTGIVIGIVLCVVFLAGCENSAHKDYPSEYAAVIRHGSWDDSPRTVKCIDPDEKPDEFTDEDGYVWIGCRSGIHINHLP